MSNARCNISIVRADGQTVTDAALNLSDLVISLRLQAEDALGREGCILVSPLGEVLSDTQGLQEAH